MFSNYLTVAWRSLSRKKASLFINVFGLTVGMTCCVLIFQYVFYEYSFDHFHKNRDRIYRVLQAYARQGDEMDQGHAYTAQALAPAIAQGVPEVEAITRIHGDDAVVSNPEIKDKVFETDGLLFVDPGFFKIFTFKSLKDDNHLELKSGEAILTKQTARKFFGDQDPVGQPLDITGSVRKTYTVARVIDDVPSNSHIQFEILLPIQDLLSGEDYSKEPEGGWSWNNFSTYVMLEKQTSVETAESKAKDIYLKNRGEIIRQQGATGSLHFQPLTDIHLNAEVMAAGKIISGSYTTVYFFLVVGLITLIVALVNYVNLATAQAMNRAREVGIRKVSGAKRGQLMTQFLVESAIANVSASVLALILASLLMPLVNDLAGTSMSPELWLNPGFGLVFLAVVIASTLLAGMYPALILSSFNPASVLKGKGVAMGAHHWFRKGLVVIQFAASVMLISGTAVVYHQLNYMQEINLGLDLERVLVIPGPRVLPENMERKDAMQKFLQEARSIPAIERAALSSTIPGKGFNWNGASIRRAEQEPADAIRGVATYIDTTFAALYGIQLVAGEDFRRLTSNADEESPWMVIINETAVKNLGFNDNEKAIGQNLDIGGYQARVLGVFKDFHWSSAHEQRQNMIFGLTQSGQYLSFKLQTKQISETLESLQGTFNGLFPGNVFTYQFADQSFGHQYAQEQRFAKLFSIAAGITILISCMGLFGLVAFAARQRTKEIGVRKVLGASVANIVAMLTQDFLKLVVAGFIIAVPVTLYIMNQWLENFAYRVTVGAGVFVLSGITALFIALITVMGQTIKAALSDPARSLRND